MQQFLSRPVQGAVAPLARLRTFWASIEYARATAAEFAALNALSDAELARMGLTRGVLKRHIHQKYSARIMMGAQAGWHDPDATDHDAEQRRGRN
ncbi:MAG: hypothetical protein QNI90_12160 [Dinoroseobacter sp.]|nr:hypothetical protein [Dinoroseobacter sp.]